MPFFRDEDLRRLTGFHDAAEYELDLRGLDLPHARASVERMLERSRFRPPRTVVIRIDKASATSGLTLFQPIGRQLVEALKAGLVLRCRPLPDGNAGFWIELAGNPRAAAGEGGADGRADGGDPC